jgi:hypothetical protein
LQMDLRPKLALDHSNIGKLSPVVGLDQGRVRGVAIL